MFDDKGGRGGSEKRMLNMKMKMKVASGLFILSTAFLPACRTAHDVAVTSFRVIDAPAHFIRRHIDEPATTTTTTTTTYQSDVATPGRPIVAPPPPPQQPHRRIVSERSSTPHRTEPSPTPRRQNREARTKASPTPAQRSAAPSQTSRIPFAKPVPGKAGYVYSPFDPNGGYVDVTGYASGSKVKDPYSGKIFIVP